MPQLAVDAIESHMIPAVPWYRHVFCGVLRPPYVNGEGAGDDLALVVKKASIQGTEA